MLLLDSFWLQCTINTNNTKNYYERRKYIRYSADANLKLKLKAYQRELKDIKDESQWH